MLEFLIVINRVDIVHIANRLYTHSQFFLRCFKQVDFEAFAEYLHKLITNSFKKLINKYLNCIN